jgi:hypothetical protein
MEEVPAKWWRCIDWWDSYGETLPEGLQALYVTFPDVNDETYTTLCIYKTDGEKPVVGSKGVHKRLASSNRLRLGGAFCLETAALERILVGETSGSNFSERIQFPLQWVQEFKLTFSLSHCQYRCICKREIQREIYLSLRPHTDGYLERRWGVLVPRIARDSDSAVLLKVFKRFREHAPEFVRWLDTLDSFLPTAHRNCECQISGY